MKKRHSSESAFRTAIGQFADRSVDVDRALQVLAGIPISIHCWQGDDVGGFEAGTTDLGGGLAVTGNHPGRARNPAELRQDIEKALSLIPGNHRFSLHAMYGEFGGKPVDRDEIGADHFRGWMDWSRTNGVPLDFNPTFFAHRHSRDGLTLSNPDNAIRKFWIEHGRRCREIAAAMGRSQGSACVNNLWIPDGFKDTPADRAKPRERLIASLDAIYATSIPPRQLLDAVEPKLFGIGAESCTVGSHEFYLGYAVTRQKMLCLDSGHFHPTESIADKISSTLLFLPNLLLHVSRGVRWDSDHVVTGTDELAAICREVVANRFLPNVRFGLDYFDASINRIAAWIIGARNLQKALLVALLEPPSIRHAEVEGDRTRRLALQEEARHLPHGIVWARFCEQHEVPPDESWLLSVKAHESSVLSVRK